MLRDIQGFSSEQVCGLLHRGEEVARSEVRAEFGYAVREPGAYRLEAWLRLDGEWRPWIFANPVYVK